MNFVIPGAEGRSSAFGVAGIENAINSQERNYVFSNAANPTATLAGGSSIITLSRYYAWVWSAIEPPVLFGNALATDAAFNFFDHENRPLFNNPVRSSTLFGPDLSIDYPMLPLRPFPPGMRIKIVWQNFSNANTLAFEMMFRGFEVLSFYAGKDKPKGDKQ